MCAISFPDFPQSSSRMSDVRRHRGRGKRQTIADIPCTFSGCGRRFRSTGALTNHTRTEHRNPTLVGGAKIQRASSLAPMLESGADSPPTNAESEPLRPLSPESEERASESRDIDVGSADIPSLSLWFVPSLVVSNSETDHSPGRPCDEDGNDLPDGAKPAPRRPPSPTNWNPYDDEVQFRVADFVFRRDQMSKGNIQEMLQIWALDNLKHDDIAPFANADHLYETIDATELGDAPWKCLVTQPLADGADAPEWARKSYEVWYRDPDVVVKNMLDNPDFVGLFDPAPYVEVDANDQRRWSDFMSANFAWSHASQIFHNDPTTEGAMICPLFFGADKTTVSVGTGDVSYHPGYTSIGNFHSSLRRAHRGAVIPFIFLAIPKSMLDRAIHQEILTRIGERKYDNDPAFRTFKRQLYHASWAAVLASLRPGMTVPVVRRCPDGHFRRVIYDFGPFIADYPEQVQLAGIVQGWCPKCTALAHDLDGPIGTTRSQALTEQHIQAFDGDPKTLWENYGINTDVIPFTHDFPRADIHEMLSPDLLHQLIKGTFKDHLVDWVYIPAIQGLLPPDIVQALSTFLDFCYLVRRRDFDEATLQEINATVYKYHGQREVFRTAGVRPDGFSLPRQHSMANYASEIKQFGVPYGVCSSITESRHITAVDEALGQMLLTNQRLDKLTASRADFEERGMLPPQYKALPDKTSEQDDDADEEPVDIPRVDGTVELARTAGLIPIPLHLRYSYKLLARAYPRNIYSLGDHIGLPHFHDLVEAYLADQPSHNSDADSNSDNDMNEEISTIRFSVFHSAIATFFAPSDQSGIRGMKRERIRCTPSWGKHKRVRRDCAYVVDSEKDDAAGFAGLSAVRVCLFFSFTLNGVYHPCALVEWFETVGRRPDPETGMWVVKRQMEGRTRLTTVVHLNTMLRSAHLIPVFGTRAIPTDLRYYHSLDAFDAFHVNKYIDHHANEIAF
ncbi:C2H2-type domain-containing protein [Mycena indigotica]|uniref:C2H2-type domain-containing protein n=1 Tax=Mycena indigotica TaxID=2126181 RepID=A0A8H6RXP8_9AGAR|nr:C2H2-type domain-containing protein [Mycena indigotica]KAF7288608.1 C2H2-type domain-containing protein [Mycena indigotica]